MATGTQTDESKTEISLVPFDLDIHDPDDTARLVVASDEELHSLTYGTPEQATQFISNQLRRQQSYYDAEHVRCVEVEGRLVGVVVGYRGEERARLDRRLGLAMLRNFGVWATLRRMPQLMKAGRLLLQDLPASAYYILNLTVDSSMRSQGIGQKIIARLAAIHGDLYLDSNRNNEGARRFYERLGFEVLRENKILVDKTEYATLSYHLPR